MEDRPSSMFWIILWEAADSRLNDCICSIENEERIKSLHGEVTLS